MPSRRIEDLDPLLAYAFGKAEMEWRLTRPNGPIPFITCTIRTGAEQNQLFNQTRDGIDNNGNGKIDEPGEKVTNAKAYESPHNFQPALAFDVAFQNVDPNKTTNWDTRLFAAFAKLVLKTPGITWGGNFKSLLDMPHFERTEWRSLPKDPA